MKKRVLHILFLLFTCILFQTAVMAQNCPSANRTVTNSKISNPHDAIGAVLKDFFEDGGSATWRFESGATFIENTNGTARLKGILAYYDKHTRRFDVDITFINQTYTAPAGSPVQMNTTGSTAGWYYYNWGTATLTGLDDLAGAKLNLKQRGKAFQVGIGASDQAPDVGKLGATGWFSWEIVSQPSNSTIKIKSFPTNYSIDQGDIAILLSGDPTNCNNPCDYSIPLKVSVETTPQLCNMKGMATAKVSGGGGGYTYKWSTGAISEVIKDLNPGKYQVTVTDKNGCSAVAEGIVTEGVSDLKMVITTTPVTCTSKGTATVSPSGGNGDYEFKWSTDSTHQTIENLDAGKYTVTLSDWNGCIVVGEAVIEDKRATDLKVTVGTTSVVCDIKGSATANATGGSGSYTYAWSNGATSKTISNLSAGTYQVTVKDGNNCTATGEGTVNNQPTDLKVVINTTAETCTAKGSASASVTGGTANYTYQWSNGSTTASITNLNAGTVKITVTDINGCTATSESTVASNKAIITCNATVLKEISEIGKDDGQVRVVASGGATPYTYKWNNGGTTPVIAPLKAGTYSVTVTDKNGCTSTCSVVLKESLCANVENPGLIEGDEEFCPGVTLKPILSKADASGGAGDIEYLWMYSDQQVFNANTWTMIPNSNNKDLQNIPMIAKTTYFIRCVRRKGCDFFKESNMVVKKLYCPNAAGTINDLRANPINGKKINISWSTKGEFIKSHYMIERSFDGQNFEEIGIVLSQNKASNDYTFEDYSMKRGKNFYRVKQMDVEGNIKFSTTEKAVLFNGNEPVLTYPNPANNKMYVELLDVENTEGVIEVYNMVGKLMFTQRFTKAQVRFEIDMSHVSDGAYILLVRPNDGKSRSTKVHKF